MHAKWPQPLLSLGWWLCLVVCAVPAGPALSQDRSPSVRQAHVAGRFYPKESAELLAQVGRFLDDAPAPRRADKPRVLISPHAGNIYSGPIAANAFRLIRGQAYAGVVVVGFTHQEPFAGSSIDARDAYETPLGRIPVDRDAVQFLRSAGPRIQTLTRVHDSDEHSLEVLLPFLQAALGNFKLVPVLMGSAFADDAQALANALAALAARGDYLFVFSTDLSHYRPYDEARRVDERTVNAILFETPLAVDRMFNSRQLEACGRGPILAALFLAEKLGHPERVLLRYANSGDTTTRRDSVVGYAAMAFYPRAAEASDGISDDAGAALVALARGSLERAIGHKSDAASPVLVDLPDLRRTRGAFVTLWKQGVLRGCIGRIQDNRTLMESVPLLALDAALRDPRFAPVQPGELAQIQVEVSVLTESVPLPDLSRLVPGRDGVVLELEGRRGVFLPSVWESSGWTRLEFLRELASQKAGLKPDDWRRAKLSVFRDQVFKERLPPPAESPPPPTTH